MKKLLTFLLLPFLMLQQLDTLAQEQRDSVILTISDLDFSEPVDEIEVCISAENFNDVWSLSYTLDWNAGIFQFLEVSYMNPLVVTTLNEDLAPQGRLPALWYDPRVEGVNLDVQNRIMCLKFKVLRSPCNGEKISMVNEPTEVSITDDNAELPKKMQAGMVINAKCDL